MSSPSPKARPTITQSLSRRLLSRESSNSTSLLGELLRSSAPPWVETLVDLQLPRSQAAKMLEAASECGLCGSSVVNRGPLEPGIKKLCTCCGLVTCRLCMTSVHMIGHLRRRYVCFQCVGTAAQLLKRPKAGSPHVTFAAPVVVVVGGGEDAKPSMEEEMSGYMQKLWERGASDAQPGLNLSDYDDEDEYGDAQSSFGGDETRSRASTLGLADSQGFDGDSLKRLLDSSRKSGEHVLAVLFTRACSEIVKLLAGLGKAFEFASTDMQGKLSIMAFRIDDTARDVNASSGQVTIQQMVEREIAAGTANAGKQARGAARTVLRLLWFYDFVAVLLRKLADEPKAEVRAGDGGGRVAAPRAANPRRPAPSSGPWCRRRTKKRWP
jgi:hypothetical protein